MPLLLLIVGLLVLVTAIRGTQGDLYTLVENDLSGFAVWFIAIFAIGLLGYIPGMEKPSRLLLAIVIFMVIAKNNGVFANLQSAFTNPLPAAASTPAVSGSLGSLPVQININGGGGGGGGILGTILGVGKTALTSGATAGATGGL